MKLALRRYQPEDDYQHIGDFVRRVFMLNLRRRLSWPMARPNYWRWHEIYDLGQRALEIDN